MFVFFLIHFFSKPKKAAAALDEDEGKKGEKMDEVYNSDSEDEEEFELTLKRENKYQKAHAHTHNVRQMQRKSADSKTMGQLARSTSKVTLPKDINGARRLKSRFGLTSGDSDYDLYKKGQESKAAYSVCKYTEPM